MKKRLRQRRRARARRSSSGGGAGTSASSRCPGRARASQPGVPGAAVDRRRSWSRRRRPTTAASEALVAAGVGQTRGRDVVDVPGGALGSGTRGCREPGRSRSPSRPQGGRRRPRSPRPGPPRTAGRPAAARPRDRGERPARPSRRAGRWWPSAPPPGRRRRPRPPGRGATPSPPPGPGRGAARSVGSVGSVGSAGAVGPDASSPPLGSSADGAPGLQAASTPASSTAAAPARTRAPVVRAVTERPPRAARQRGASGGRFAGPRPVRRRSSRTPWRTRCPPGRPRRPCTDPHRRC